MADREKIYRVVVEFPPLPHSEVPHRLVMENLTEREAERLYQAFVKNLVKVDGEPPRRYEWGIMP